MEMDICRSIAEVSVLPLSRNTLVKLCDVQTPIPVN